MINNVVCDEAGEAVLVVLEGKWRAGFYQNGLKNVVK